MEPPLAKSSLSKTAGGNVYAITTFRDFLVNKLENFNDPSCPRLNKHFDIMGYFVGS